MGSERRKRKEWKKGEMIERRGEGKGKVGRERVEVRDRGESKRRGKALDR